MYLVDTHCHLHDREFFTEKQAEEMLARAKARKVEQIICVGTNHEDSMNAKKIAESHTNVFWTYGIHPEFANTCASGETVPFLPAYRRLRPRSGKRSARDDGPERLASGKTDCRPQASLLVAVGEIGLDYHYEGYDRQKQIQLLEQMLDLACELDLPCSFHVREAFDDFFAVIKNFPKLRPSVLHSFSDTEENFWKAIERGFFIGINGLATFTNIYNFLKNDERSTSVVRDRFLLETDAPFLTPAPNRGKINEPGNVADVATWLAKKFEISETKVAEWTTKNARTVFNLQNPESTTGACA